MECRQPGIKFLALRVGQRDGFRNFTEAIPKIMHKLESLVRCESQQIRNGWFGGHMVSLAQIRIRGATCATGPSDLHAEVRECWASYLGLTTNSSTTARSG